jgi:hypothetical protein
MWEILITTGSTKKLSATLSKNLSFILFDLSFSFDRIIDVAHREKSRATQSALRPQPNIMRIMPGVALLIVLMHSHVILCTVFDLKRLNLTLPPASIGVRLAIDVVNQINKYVEV